MYFQAKPPVSDTHLLLSLNEMESTLQLLKLVRPALRW